VFFRMIPGDPIQTLLQSLQQKYAYNQNASAELLERYRTEFGLDGSLLDQYLLYFKKLLVDRDLGPSLIAYPKPAASVIADALPWTVGLLGVAAVLSWLIGVGSGALAGWRRGKRGAELATNVSVIFCQVPYYFVALVLVFVLSYQLGWFPPRSAYNSSVTPGLTAEFVGSVLYHAALPAISIVVIGFLGWLLSTRMLMVPLLGEDYLVYAEAKGLRPRTILTQYALRNVYLPQVTAFGIGLGFIFNGNVLVEQLFNYPGLGSTLVTAIGILDFNTIMGISNISILAVLTANLVLDLILPALDPRVKYWR